MLTTFRRAVACLFTAVAALTCVAASPAPGVVAAAAPITILTIGDSITQDGRWQAEFDRLLTAAGVAHNPIVNVGVGGTRCNYWPSRIGGLLSQHNPDLVVYLCGTNDDPNERSYGEVATAPAFRSTVEQIHTFRAANPVRVLPGLIGYSDSSVPNAPSWLVPNEKAANDVLWPNMQYYLPPRVPAYSWFPGVVDLQRLPATGTYLDDGGVHPTSRGYRYMGRMLYDVAAPGMGWPASLEPPLCDLYGHVPGYTRPSGYTTCLN